jgi:hypothetical protein
VSTGYEMPRPHIEECPVPLKELQLIWGNPRAHAIVKLTITIPHDKHILFVADVARSWPLTRETRINAPFFLGPTIAIRTRLASNDVRDLRTDTLLLLQINTHKSRVRKADAAKVALRVIKEIARVGRFSRHRRFASNDAHLTDRRPKPHAPLRTHGQTPCAR